MKDNKIAQERWDMAKIMADNFHINGEKWDDSDFEWTAHCLQAAGYHKQSKGKWKLGESGCMYFCSNCNYAAHPREEEEWNFCPNCGAKMKGGE
jgi:ferredoxin-like protein FixX